MSDAYEQPCGEELLSGAGRRRREEILDLALGQARAQRRGRRLRRGLAATLSLGVIVFVTGRAWMRHSPGPAAAPSIAQRPSTPMASAPAEGPRPVILVGHLAQHPREITIGRVETDPQIVARLALPRQTPTWQKLSDEELLQRLAESGRPAGLAYVGGHAMVLYRGHRDEARKNN